ncbi:MAG: Fur family transcriptional regulator [bacterium]|nr:Fur family transcriptional regulator [bacterium]
MKPDTEIRAMLSGHKATQGRIRLLGILRKASAPLTIQELLQRLGKNAIDKVTVYRIVKILQKESVIRQIDFQHGHAHYELAHPENHHHHFVCIRCGKTKDFKNASMENLLTKASKGSPDFPLVKHHSLEIFGFCRNCTKKHP